MIEMASTFPLNDSGKDETSVETSMPENLHRILWARTTSACEGILKNDCLRTISPTRKDALEYSAAKRNGTVGLAVRFNYFEFAPGVLRADKQRRCWDRFRFADEALVNDVALRSENRSKRLSIERESRCRMQA